MAEIMTIEELARDRNRLRREVIEWMTAEGQAGRLRRNDVPHRDTGELSEVQMYRTLRPFRDMAHLKHMTEKLLQEMFVHEFWEQVRFGGDMVKDPHAGRVL